MTVVYVDSVFVLNTLMDYLLLTATAHLAGVPPRRVRYLLAAALGGAYAVAVFLPGCGFLSRWPVKIAAGILMALASYGGERRLARLTVLLFTVSCGFAGCALGLGLLAGGGIPMENGVFYTDVDAKVLLAAAGAAYLTLSAVFRAGAKNGGARGNLIRTQVGLGERSVSLTALCDTGNALQDPMTGRPVLVAAAFRLEGLWPEGLRAMLTEEALRRPAQTLEALDRVPQARRFRLLPYRAVGVSGGLLLAFRSDWVQVGRRTYRNLLVALSPTELGGGFDALWGGVEQEGAQGHETSSEKTRGAAAKSRAASPGGSSLYRRQRHPAAAASPGAGGGAAGADRPGGCSADADRAQPAAGGIHRKTV